MSRFSLLLVATLAAFVTVAHAEVNVRFIAPDRFIDAAGGGSFGQAVSGTTLDELRRHITSLGERCLRPGQTLDVAIRDIDLAGQQVPRRGSDGDFWRVLIGVSNPRIDLTYVWRSATGAVLRQGADHLAQANFLPDRLRDPRTGDSLYYEKELLTRWFEARFCKSAEASTG